MFIDEAKIAVQLNHANICQIFDLGKVDDSYFIALEFVHGKDLRVIFDRCKKAPISDSAAAMPIAQACFIIMKACEGLDYAHNKRDPNGNELHLVHRDVSPHNILVSYEGEIKLIDFGIAKAAGKVSETQQGILKGKFGYMSPEQVRGLPLDRRSDVFSIRAKAILRRSRRCATSKSCRRPPTIAASPTSSNVSCSKRSPKMWTIATRTPSTCMTICRRIYTPPVTFSRARNWPPG
jgi:serine/threonine protein kinase